MIKSIYISFYLLYLLFALVANINGFFHNAGDIYWLGAILCPLLPLIFFTYLFVKRPFSVRSWQLVLTPLIFAAWLISLGQLLVDHESSIFPVVTGGIVSVGWILYDQWYAKFRRPDKQKLEEQVLSPMIFTQQNGETIDVSEESTEFKIFIFHRDSWCPFCVAQAREMGVEYEELLALGASVNFISNQKDAKNRWMQTHSSNEFRFLSDPKNQVAKKLGIAVKHGLPLGLQMFGYKSEVVLPTVLITNGANKVLRAYTAKDYRNRPLPEVILRSLRKFQATNS